MELQQLRYFREVADREHVTRAAESLFVSQSAISRAVTQLEEELGVPLFYRQGRAVVAVALWALIPGACHSGT
jgi:LysR family transcriptional activator of glutamate synthase operon